MQNLDQYLKMDDHALLAHIAMTLTLVADQFNTMLRTMAMKKDLLEVGKTAVSVTDALQLTNEKLDSIGETLEIIAPLSNPDTAEMEFNLSPLGRRLEEISRAASRIEVHALRIEQHVAGEPHDP